MSQVVDGNAGTVSSFPARTTVARHDRFCLQVLAWLVRPCGFDSCPSCLKFFRPFLPPGRGQGGRSTPPLSRHHVGNRACVAARPGKKTPPANPLTCYGGISWGCLRVVDGNAGTVSSFPARTTVARHDRFCLQVLAWLVRPCGFDLARRVSQVLWSTPPPGSQARVKPKAQAGRRSRPRFI